jgi:hypothetical protein
LVRGVAFVGSLVWRLSSAEDKGKIGFRDGNGDPSWSGREEHGASYRHVTNSLDKNNSESSITIKLTISIISITNFSKKVTNQHYNFFV